MTRIFDDQPAKRSQTPLLVGLTGPSGSGKTFSALRLASGMQRVLGGELFVIDTEARRALHYAELFKFRHIDFQPPHGPLDYLAAIEHCVERGAKVIVVDSCTHEHSGIGGVVEQSEKWLDEKCGDDWKKRERMQMLSWVKPKQQRKRLNARIVQLGINAIFCYRALEKLKPIKGGEPEKLGWMPETTSPLHYEMTVRFLLAPGSGGVPMLQPEHAAERVMIKDPEQFKGWWKPGEALSEEMGERMARWAAGGAASSAQMPSFRSGPLKGQPLTEGSIDNLLAYEDDVRGWQKRATADKTAAIAAHLTEISAALAALEITEKPAR